MSDKKLVSLIKILHQLGVLTVERSFDRQRGVTTLLNSKIGEVIHSRSGLRWSIAELFVDRFLEHYEENGRLIPFGVIGVSPGMEPLVSRISDWVAEEISKHGGSTECPIPAMATKVREGKFRAKIYGVPRIDYRYALVDDILKKGETLAGALRFWIALGYKVDHIFVLFNRGQDGLAYLKEQIGTLPGNSRFPIGVTCLITPQDVVEALR